MSLNTRLYKSSLDMPSFLIASFYSLYIFHEFEVILVFKKTKELLKQRNVRVLVFPC